ncbi:hypothetical protein BV339_00351 [Pseudomonas syringae pv. actinidiae]|nr:hypothetical protein BV339_00351 [Pseudomonas syringae pv. actinidiae]
MLQCHEGILLQGLEGTLLQALALLILVRLIDRHVSHSADSGSGVSWWGRPSVMVSSKPSS